MGRAWFVPRSLYARHHGDQQAAWRGRHKKDGDDDKVATKRPRSHLGQASQGSAEHGLQSPLIADKKEILFKRCRLNTG